MKNSQKYFVVVVLACIGAAGAEGVLARNESGPDRPFATTAVVVDQIAFVTTRDGNSEIYRMHNDGSNPHNITNHPGNDTDPSWSPDGSQLAFQTFRASFMGDVYLMNSDGSSQALFVAHASNPAWAPSGTQLAYLAGSFVPNGNEIYVIDADGTDATNITNNGYNEFGRLSWSPNGDQLAFTFDVDGNSEIYKMNANGSGRVRLTYSAEHDRNGAWSPDGTKILFTAQPWDGSPEIYTMNTNGSMVTQLTTNDEIDGDPTWSPDGTRIAFASDRDGNREIYVMNADGSGVVRLTHNPAIDYSPAWGQISISLEPSVFIPLVTR